MKDEWLAPRTTFRRLHSEGRFEGHELISGTKGRKRVLACIRHPKGERTCELAALLRCFQELHDRPFERIDRVEVSPAPRGLYALGDFEAVEYTRPDGRRYRHEFGEEGGELPLLCADARGKLHVVGGSYRVTSHGIED